MNIVPVTLEGDRVRLVPMSTEYFEQLCDAGIDESLWRVTMSLVRTREAMQEYIDDALKLQAEGKALPFVTIEKSTTFAVGSTRFMNIDRANKRLEIGSTW